MKPVKKRKFLCKFVYIIHCKDMIYKFLSITVALLVGAASVFAASDPGKLIPEPVEYVVSEGVYTLKPDASDIKVTIGAASFASKVQDLPDFARQEAYEVVVGKKGVKIYAMTEEGAFRGRQTVEMQVYGNAEALGNYLLHFPQGGTEFYSFRVEK